jgi:AcrR family transcriptional regulator
VPASRTRNPRGAGHRLRDDLLNAAAQLLQEGGEAALTMRAVTRAVGAAPQSIYAHFTDREDLLWAVLRGWFAELERVLQQGGNAESNPRRRLEHLSRTYCRYGLMHPHRYRLLLLRDRPVRHDAPLEEFPGAGVFRIMQAAVADVLADSVPDQKRAPQPAAFLATTDLLATLHGAVLFRIGLPSFPWPDVEDNIQWAIYALTLHGTERSDKL